MFMSTFLKEIPTSHSFEPHSFFIPLGYHVIIYAIFFDAMSSCNISREAQGKMNFDKAFVNQSVLKSNTTKVQ